MLSKNFEILTPLSKLHRISRQIHDTDTFAVEAGMFVGLDTTGRLVNLSGVITAGTVELCISNAIAGKVGGVDNPLASYEGNDTKIGSATTIAEPGIRVAVGDALVTGTPSIGDAAFVAEDGAGFDTNATVGIKVGVVTGVGSLTEIRLIEPTVVA
jgi:hypothetical protein